MSDAYYDKVVLLLPLKETLDDYSIRSHVATATGNAAASTSQSKYYSSSTYFDGSGDYVTVSDSDSWYFAGGDFTIELWAYPTAVGQTNSSVLVDQATDASQYAPIVIAQAASGYGVVISGSYALNAWNIFQISAGTMTANAWNHIAVVRSGTTLYTFVNGVAGSTSAIGSNTFPDSSQPLCIGGGNFTSTYFTGYLQDLRITKGYARYTAGFTPPGKLVGTISGTVKDDNNSAAARIVRAYPRLTGLPKREAQTYTALGDPYWGYVVLGMHMDGADNGTTFTDVTGKTVTAYGNACTKTATKQFGSASAYFDGNAATYLSVPSTGLSLGVGDFTIEAWVRFASPSTYQYLLASDTMTGGYFQLAINGMASNAIGIGRTSVDWPLVWSGHNMVANTWYHLAISRGGGYARCFLNGVQLASAIASTHDFVVGANALHIGHQASNGTMTGYIDDLRITVGASRYTGLFTPPNAAFYDNYGGPLSAGAFSLTVPDAEHILIVLDDDAGSTYNDLCTRVIPT